MKKIVLICLIIAGLLNAETKVSQGTYKKLQKAQKFIKQKQYNSALLILNPIVKSNETNIGKSYAYQAIANIYIAKQQYRKAANNYEKTLSLKALPKEDLQKIKFSLSQIYLSESLYSKSLKYSKQLLNTKAVKQSVLVENIALAYYYNKQYSKAVPFIKRVIKQKKKKEEWYRMLYSSYIESKNYNGAITTLKSLVKKYSSKEEYWMQLISIYQTTKRYKKSLATLELAYKKNVVNKAKNLMYFVNILLQNKIYNKSGLIMKDAINRNIIANNQKNFNILISCFLNAKNYKEAIPRLRNSKFAFTDKYKLILGNIYFNSSKYKKAINVLKNYKFRKNTKFDGQRYTLLALSAHELKNKKETVRYLKKASLNSYEKRRARSLARDLGYKI